MLAVQRHILGMMLGAPLRTALTVPRYDNVGFFFRGEYAVWPDESLSFS